MTMMSLEMFHEQILKGKNPQEVYELIEDFKIEMIFLKGRFYNQPSQS